MARNDKSSVSNLQNEEHKRILTSLLREEGNRRCADCNSRGPTWASVNLGVFVCLNCSGIHRSLGVHISKVRSTNLDTWLPEQVAFVQAMGNVRCNKYWEARLPRDFHRPPESDMGALRNYITDKYVNKRYALQGYSESPCLENYMSHPFVVELARGGNKSGENGTAVVVASEEAAKPPAAITDFDLLSLNDESTPAGIPQQHQMQQQQRLQAASAPAPAQAPAAPGVNWDPFAAIAREPVEITSSPLNSNNPTTNKNSNVATAPIIDPFAEIERTASSRGNATAASLMQASSPLGSIATNGGSASIVDPFALAPLPPQSTSNSTSNTTAAAPLMKPGVSAAPMAAPPPSNTTAAAIAAAPLVKSVVSAAPVAAPPLAATSSGSLGVAPMRSSSTNGHSKGKVSHEDILAMFDK